jgi:lipoprotein-releasing system permease protein
VFRTFLSWRYLVSRRTNLIGVVSIFLGVFAPVLIYSIMSGFLSDSRELLRGNLSDVIVAPLFTERADGRDVERLPATLLQLARSDPRASAATARLSWYGILAQGGPDAAHSRMVLSNGEYGHLSAVELLGVDVLTTDKVALALYASYLAALGVRFDPTLEDELDGARFHESLTETPSLGARVENPVLPFHRPRNYRPRGRPKASVIVCDALYGYLGLQRGSILHISTAVPDPVTGTLSASTREFVVAGSFRSRTSELDRIYVERSELADMLQDGREFSEVLVSLDDFEADAAAFCRDLAAAGYAAGALRADDGEEIRTWEQTRKGLIGAVENERVLMGIMLGLVLLVSGFTIFAILSMLVTEKRRDIGILTALGATPRGILVTFLLIGFWDALIGTTIGGALGVWAALRVGELQMWLEETFGIVIFRRDTFAFDRIPSQLDPWAVGAMVVLAYICTLLFAAGPAWRAARLDPIDALRYE